MDEREWLAQQFEAERPHLRAVAYRMLGSLSEAEDAVQESWLHLNRSDTSDVANLGGWLTTVVARVCLDMLRSRKSRHEESLDVHVPDPIVSHEEGIDPEQEALLADSVGLALLVVLDTLNPAERLAFVLHDLFAVPFDEIANIVGRSETATRQLASRARRRVRGGREPDADLTRSREVVDAFLAASRAGDFGALLAMLDPDVVCRIDATAMKTAEPVEIRDASAVARQFLRRRATAARTALVDGDLGIVVAPHGRLLLVIKVKVAHGKIVEIDAVADPERLRQVHLAAFKD
jgi:RNA polymerase sigma factor (sigma-70 family)